MRNLNIGAFLFTVLYPYMNSITSYTYGLTEKHALVHTPTDTLSEKLWKFSRNINALGALAIGGIALAIPDPNVFLVSWAGLNAAQAGGFEFLRKNSENKRWKKHSG